MSDLIEVVERLLLTPQPASEAETMELLKDVAGRGEGQYGARLKEWLESDLSVYPEPITVQLVDNPDDMGVDVLLTGRQTKLRIGFQIKSDNDLKAEQDKFVREAKAQYTEAGVWDLALYVFVMACRLTPGNVRKYTFLQNTFARMPNSNVLWLEPGRAAGLLRAFGSPLPRLAQRPKGWAEFFISARQRNLADVYLSELPGLPPHERFQPPSEWKEIVRLTDSRPLTVLTGPPAVGKTFTAVQLLWRAFQQGRKILWITQPRPQKTEGPIADPLGMPDMRERVELVTRELGLHAHRPPLDAAEFVVAHLEPDSLVYIEDPFGKMDDEFQHSLHTYEFFDLDRFVSDLSPGEPRSSCHILITSREGLFDRWLEERRRKGSSTSEIALVKMGADSYSVTGRIRLAGSLLAARGVTAPVETAISIAEHLDVPFDATLIARDIPQNATHAQVVASAEKISHQYTDKLSGLIPADTDAERLFLMLLSALSMDGMGRYDFYTSYEMLHNALGIGGDVYSDVQASLMRYRPLYTRLDIARFDALRGVVSEHADFHLESVHSTVNEAINSYLIGSAIDFLDRVALVLPELGDQPVSTSTEMIVGMFILRLAFDDIQERSRDAIFDAFFGNEGSHLDMRELLSWWGALPDKYREQFFNFIARQKTNVISETCSMLTTVELPEQDAWRLLRLLVDHPGLGAPDYRMWGDPWAYVGEHIERIQPDLKRRLDEEAKARPETFTFALCDVLVAGWEDISAEWRDAFMDPKSLSDLQVQERALTAIARRFDNAPADLRRLFDRQANNPNHLMRAAMAVAALLAHKSDPMALGRIATKVAEDPDVRAPLYVLTRTRGDGKQYRHFVGALLNRSDEAAAACLLNILLYDGKGEPKPGWKFEAAQESVAKGGDLARAVLAFNSFEHPRGSAALGYSPAASVREESSKVRLAWIWSYANRGGRKPPLAAEEVRELVESLDENERLLAINYLTAQAESLPPEARELIELFRTTNQSYEQAIEDGKLHLQPRGHGRRTWSYPSEQFLTGERTSLYDSMLTYSTISIPVLRGAGGPDDLNDSQRSFTVTVIRPTLDNIT